MRSVVGSLRFIVRHPLNAGYPISALSNYARCQLALRTTDGARVMPWVQGSVLVVTKGMTGATGNLYCGLHELQGMGFLLHFLQPGDLFVDVGANVGSYTVLASRVCDAKSIAIEPVPETSEWLQRNLEANQIGALVESHRVGISDTSGDLYFTAGYGPMNHVASGPGPDTVVVPVVTLDSVVGDRSPALVKIDVEGWEDHVVVGAHRTLSSARACLMEIGEPEGGSDLESSAAFQFMVSSGFHPVSYDPLTRTLISLDIARRTDANVLFVRDVDDARARVQSAPHRTIRRRLV